MVRGLRWTVLFGVVLTSLVLGAASAFGGGVVVSVGAPGADDADVFVLDEDGGHRLLVETPGRVTRAAWDPTGSRLLLTDLLPDRRADHRVVTFDGVGRVVGNERLVLVSAPPARFAASAVYGWHPSGDSVLFKREDRACAGNVVWRRFLDGREEVFLDPAVVGDGVVYSIDFHPNGREVLWTSQVGCWSPSLKVFRAGLVDGSVDLRSVELLLDDGQYVAPAVYSPDGEWVAFRRSDASRGYGGPENVYVMRADGGDVRALTSNTGAAQRVLGQIVWSADGREVVFGQSFDWTGARTVDVYRARVDGSGVRRVSASVGQTLVLAAGQALVGVEVADPRAPDARASVAAAEPGARFRIDWGRLDALRGVEGFSGVASETSVTWSYEPAGGGDAWYLDVVVSGAGPAGVVMGEGAAYATVFPAGVVSVALPEPLAWVDYEGVSLAVLDRESGEWVGVEDVYRRTDEDVSGSVWRRLAFVGLDVASLAVPKVQALKLLLVMHDVIEDWVSESLDASTLWPRDPVFYDPNAFRVVQVPWRFDGSEVGVWDAVPYEGGVVPVRVRLPVMGVPEAVVAELATFVAFTEEHSFFQPGADRLPMTGSTAAPVYPEPRLLGRPSGLRSVSFHEVRALERSAWVRVESSASASTDKARWLERLRAQRDRPLHPDLPGVAAVERAVAELGFVRVGQVSSILWSADPEGDRAWRLVASVEGSSFTLRDGRLYVSGTDAWTVGFTDGVAYAAIPNLPGLVVAYDDVRIEAYNHRTGVWDVMDNAYVAPARERAGERAQRAALGVLIGRAVEVVAGKGIARGVKVVGIAADIAGIAGLVPADAMPATLPMPEDGAFYDPNRFRLVEVPWRLELVPYSVRLDEGAAAYRNPYDPDQAGMRLRVVVPVTGLPESEVPHVRGFVAALERITHWRTTGGIDTASGRAAIEPVTTYTRLIDAPLLASEPPVAARGGDGAAEGPASGTSSCRTLVVIGRDVHGVGSPPDVRGVARVRIGRFHALALLDDGALVAWGRDDFGQGSVPDGLPDEPLVAVSVGVNDSFAVSRSGMLFAWGDGHEGVATQEQPGLLGLTTGSAYGTRIFDDGTVRYRASTSAQQALVDEQQGAFVEAAASNRGAVFRTERGLLGSGDLAPPDALRSASDVLRIAVGDHGAAAVHADGSTSFWGSPWSTSYVRASLPAPVIDVAVGRDFAAFLLADGRLVVEGYDRFGIGRHALPDGHIVAIEAGYDALGVIYEPRGCVP